MLLLLAGCQPTTEKQAATTATKTPATAAPAAARQSPAAPFTGYHRYRGKVGGQPVIVELTMVPTIKADLVTCQGSYYYERRGGELTLRSTSRAGAPLTLTETAAEGQLATGHWQAQTPAGPVLTGTWTSARGHRQVPFTLREDYTGAVRYEIVDAAQTGPSCQVAPEGGTAYAQVRAASLEFVHLLGPDTLRPALRALQCPAPAQRLALAREALESTDCESEEYGTTTDITITLNGYGLLSMVVTESENSGGPYPNGDNEPCTYSLATGQLCDPLKWLRSDCKGTIYQLLTKYMQADSIASSLAITNNDGQTELPTLRGTPPLGLNSEGLFCTMGNFDAPHVVQRRMVTIPYAKLRPYVRPNTPLARLLAARHL